MDNFENNRNWANQISEKLEHLTEGDVLNYLNELESKWKLPDTFEEQFNTILNNSRIEFTSIRKIIKYREYLEC